MSTSSDQLSVLRSIVLMASFRGNEFNGVCAGLLLIGLQGHDFNAAMLPKELTAGDIHISGAATRCLLTMGLLEKRGYCPSPNADAKGRPVCVLRIPNDKVSTARTWLTRHGYPTGEEQQASFALEGEPAERL